jgi:O-antigen/teichoic acid export membrane protein
MAYSRLTYLLRRGRHSGSFLGDVARLTSGTTVAQVLSVLVAPLFARLFAPEAFGVSALFSSAVTVLGTLECMGYHMAIMLPSDDRDAAQVVSICLLVAALLALAILGLVVSLRGWLQSVPGLTPIASYFGLLALAVFLSGSMQTLRQWNNRRHVLRPLALAPLASAVVIILHRLVGVVWGGDGAAILVWAQVSGGASAAALQVLYGWRSLQAHWSHTRPRQLVRQAQRYSKFPLYSVWSELLNALSVQVPVFMLSAYFDQAVVGNYALAARVVGLPSVLIRAAIGQVFLRRAAIAHREGRLGEISGQLFRNLVLLSCYGYLAIACVGDLAFGVIFGPEWLPAGRMAQMIAPWQLVVFVAAPLNNILVITEHQEAGLVSNISLFAARVAAFAVGGLLGRLHLAIGLYALTGIIGWGILTAWQLRLAHARWSGWQEAARTLGLGLVALSLTLAARVAFPQTPWPALGLAVIGATLYYGYGLSKSPQVWRFVQQLRAVPGEATDD